MKKQPTIILVHPQIGENIGMCMRAMLNFNLTDLRLVHPRPNWSQQTAVNAAAGAAQTIMPKMKIYPTTQSATADLQYLIAATARPRNLALPIITPKQTAQIIGKKIKTQEKCGILFGSERSGLNNDDITQAHAIMQFNTNPKFHSLNLAQAVMLIAYEFSIGTKTTTPENSPNDSRTAKLAEIDFFCRGLDDKLHQSGFYRSPDMRPHVKRNLRVMFQRMQPSQQEIKTWHGIIKSLMRKPAS